MIDYDDSYWLIHLLPRIRGSVVPRALCFALPGTLVTILMILCREEYEDILGTIGLTDRGLSASTTFSASTAGIGILLAFRTNQAMSRYWEGTTLLHQMRGEWFDAVSCLMTFSRGSLDAKPNEVREFRHTLVRLMSLCHGCALEEIKADEKECFEVVDIMGLGPETIAVLEECKTMHGFNRVEVLIHMIQVLVTHNLDNGVLKVAPPILSRVYQTLSRGLVNILNAMKIKTTRFPFPYAQIIAILLLTHMMLTPFLVSACFDRASIAAMVAFLPVFGMFSLNFIAAELEMPFGTDDNDLPLEEFQRHMNQGLLMLLHPCSDHLAATSKLCLHTFDDISGCLRADDSPDLDHVTSQIQSGSRLGSRLGSARTTAPKIRGSEMSVDATTKRQSMAACRSAGRPSGMVGTRSWTTKQKKGSHRTSARPDPAKPSNMFAQALSLMDSEAGAAETGKGLFRAMNTGGSDMMSGAMTGSQSSKKSPTNGRHSPTGRQSLHSMGSFSEGKAQLTKPPGPRRLAIGKSDSLDSDADWKGTNQGSRPRVSASRNPASPRVSFNRGPACTEPKSKGQAESQTRGHETPPPRLGSGGSGDMCGGHMTSADTLELKARVLELQNVPALDYTDMQCPLHSVEEGMMTDMSTMKSMESACGRISEGISSMGLDSVCTTDTTTLRQRLDDCVKALRHSTDVIATMTDGFTAVGPLSSSCSGSHPGAPPSELDAPSSGPAETDLPSLAQGGGGSEGVCRDCSARASRERNSLPGLAPPGSISLGNGRPPDLL